MLVPVIEEFILTSIVKISTILKHTTICTCGFLTFHCIIHQRDVDRFIEHLENTIAFFTGLEKQSPEDQKDDDFVPFI